MKYQLSSHAKRQLTQLLGLRDNRDTDIDEMLGMLLQLSLALMMIFMISFCLFQLNTTAEFNAVKQLQEQQLLNEQRQKLILAGEKTEDFFLTRYGLKTVAVIGEDNVQNYNGALVIENGKLCNNTVLRHAFVNGAKNLAADYADTAALTDNWRNRILAQAGYTDAELDSSNLEWLAAQLPQRIEAVKANAKIVQTQAAAAVQSFLAEHPEQASSDRIRSLLDQYLAANAEQRQVIQAELGGVLRLYAFEYLKQQIGCPLLEEL